MKLFSRSSEKVGTILALFEELDTAGYEIAFKEVDPHSRHKTCAYEFLLVHRGAGLLLFE